MVRKHLPSTRTISVCLFVLAINLLVATAGFAQTALQQRVAPPVSSVEKMLKESRNSIQFIENKGQWPAQTIAVGQTNVGSLIVKRNELNFITIKPHGKADADEEVIEEEEDEDHELHEAHGWGMSFDGYNANYTVERSQPFVTKYNYFLGDGSTNTSDVSAYGEQTLKNIYNGIDLRMYSQEKNTIEFDWVVNPGADYKNIKMRFKGQDGLRIDEKGDLEVKLRFQEVKFDIPEVYQVINGKKVLLNANFVVKGEVATFNIQGEVNPNFPLIIDPSLKWGIFFDCNSNTFDEYLYAIELDNSGNVYCGGKINMTVPTTYIASGLFGYSNTYGGSVDGIVYKINANGTAVLAITYFGGSAQDGVYGLGLSPDKSILYACGYTDGTIPTNGGTTAFDNAIGGSQDGFVFAVNASNLNTLQYSTYIGSSGGGDEMRSIRGLSNNSFVVGGIVNAALSTSAPNYIGSAYDASYDGSNEMYIAKFTNFNTLTFGTYVGGNGSDDLNDIAVFSDGKIAFSGSTASTGSFPGLINSAGAAGSGTDGVVGVIPASGGTFDMLTKVGGTQSDECYGLTIGPFDTLFVTGITSSSTAQGFPLGTGSRFDITQNGGQDAFIAKLPKFGGTNTWQATYFGGSGDERGNTLRTYTPYAVMVFGETQSNNFPCKNLADGGNFYDSTSNGGWDIFYMVMGTDLQTQYFATYIGGSQNDYLGATGTPKGSNHFQVEGDTLICLGTTVHSSTLTPNPVGPAGTVFDASRSDDSDNDDIHLVFKWRIGGNLLNFDFGDAPLSYNLGSTSSPNHYIFNSLKLGTNIDREDFHSPTPGTKANVDDLAGATPDDEDALSVTQVMIQDTATRYGLTFPIVNTTGFNAVVMGWIDFNGNGVFDNSEVDTALVASGATSASLVWTGINFNSASDTSYLRLRITAQSSFFTATPSPTANAVNGEIEDYMVLKYHCVDLTGATITATSPTNCTPPNGSISIANGHLLPNVTYTIYYSYNGGPNQGPFNLTTQNNGTLVIPGLNSGTYTTVQVFHPTNPLCGDTITGPLVLVPTSVATPTVTATPNPVCTGQTVQFTATGTGTFSWTGPSSFTSSLQNPTRSITSTAMAGTYSVTQTVNGCVSNPGTVNLVVNTTPAITLSTSAGPTTCGGSNGTITIAGVNNNTLYSVTYTKNGGAPTTASFTSNASGNLLVITGLTAGTYTNISVSLSGCPSNVLAGPVTLNDPANPAAPTGVTASPNPVCEGGTLTLSATGTSLSWTFPNGGGTATGSPVTRTPVTLTMGGTYSVTQTVNNCTSAPATVVVTVNPKPTFTFSTSSNPTTCGGSQGSISFSGLTASTTYSVTYVKNGSNVGPVNIATTAGGVLTITGLTAGTYTNFVVTLSGCASNAVAGPITLTDPSAPAAPSGVTATPNPVCTGSTLTLSATGSSLSWTYPDGPTASGSPVSRTNVTAAMAGTYSVTQTVAGCVSPAATVVVTVNTTPAITLGTTTNPTTCSGNQGTITLNGLVASQSYTVNYLKGGLGQGPVTIVANGSGQVVITGLTAGTYTNFSVTLSGCTSNTLAGPVTLTDPANPAAPTSVSASPNPVCEGSTLTLTAVGSNLTWTFPNGGGTASGSPVTRTNVTLSMAGTYSVTQTVNNCNSSPATVSVTVNAKPVVTFSTSSNPTTCGGTNGSISFSGLNASTTYSVSYDKNGSAVGTSSISTSAGGVLTISGLTAGSYTNFVLTLNGCASDVYGGPVTLSDPATPAAPTNVSATPNPVCQGGTLTLSATGTNLSWTFPNGGGTAAGSPVTRTPVTLTMAGTYSVTQTVAGCTSAPATVLVNVNPTPVISGSSSTNPTTCGGTDGSITLNGLSANTIYAVTYLKNGVSQGPVNITSNGGGSIVITGLGAGTYTNFSATLSGCASSTFAGPITLSDPTTPSAPTAVTATPNPACTGQTVQFNATGVSGATFSWTGPQSFTSTLQNPTRLITATNFAGVYSVTQTVAGCTSGAGTVTLTVNPTPVITAAAGSNPTTCGGSQGTVTISGLTNGTSYSVTYTKNGSAQGPVTLVANASGQIVITGLTSGTYNNFVVTAAGCPSAAYTTAVTLTDPAAPSAPSLSSNTPVCAGDTIKLFSTAVAGATYSWSGPLGFTSSLQNPIRTNSTVPMGGTYSVLVTAANSCTVSTSTTVVVNPTPSVSASSNSPVCANSNISLTSVPAGGAGGYTYLWSGPSSYSNATQNPTITNVSAANAGTYTIRVTDLNSCSATASTAVVVNARPSVSASSNSPVCQTFNINLTSTPSGGNGSYSYLWSGPNSFGSNTQNPSIVGATTAATGVYTVTVTDGNTCTATANTSVTVTSKPATPSASATPNPICTGQTLNLSVTGTGGATFSWVGPNGFTSTSATPSIASITTAGAGVYKVVQTASGCTSDTATVTVVVNTTPNAPAAAATPNPICSGNTLSLSATGQPGATYSWSGPNAFSSTSQNPTIAAITTAGTGTYSVTQTVSGCTSTASGTVNVTVNQTPTAPTPTTNGPVCYGDTLKLFASTVAGATYSWSGPSGYTSSAQNPVRANAVPAMSGTYSLVITVTGCSSTNAATVAATVNSCPPVAVNDNYSTNEDTPLNVSTPGVLTNDYDPATPQQPLTVSQPAGCGPLHGSVTLNANGSFTYTPAANYTGLDSFCYRACDNESPAACDTAYVIVNVLPVNDKPVINDSTVTTPEDVPVTVCIPISDPETATQTHSITNVYCGPNSGSISGTTVNNAGNPHLVCVTYAPNANYNGTDSVCLVVCDNGTPQLCDTTKITIVVTPVNDKPLAVDDIYPSCVDTAIRKNVLSNDVDIDGPALQTIGTICGPFTGSLVLQLNGNFVYTPTPAFNGVDSFCYVVCDGGTPNLCDTGVAVLDYSCVNIKPIANNDNYTTPEDVTLNVPVTGVLTNDNDPDGGILTVNTTPVVNVAHGTLTLNSNGSFTYVPATNYFGLDSFIYAVCDNGVPVKCDSATVYITVTPVNDAPVVGDSTITTPEDQPITVCVPFSDVDLTDLHAASLLCNPASGTVSNITVSDIFHTLCVTYTPNTNFNGNDSLCLVICDNGLPSKCDTSHIRITVTPVNDPPVAINDAYTTNEDQTLTVAVGTGVRANDNDNADGNPVTSLTVTTTPVVNVAHGTLTLNNNGSFTYVPTSNFCGNDSFQYRVCDNGTPLPSLCDTATAYISIICVNDPPVVVDTPVTTCEDCGPITVCVPITDPDNTTFNIGQVLCGPNSGTANTSIVFNTACVTYTANNNFNGVDSICLVVCDNGSPVKCDTTKITITVTPVNDPPVAVNDNYSTNEDQTLTVAVGSGVRANDNDNADGNPVTSLTVTTTPIVNVAHGTLTLNNNGSFTYVPTSNFCGNDSFQYRVCDNGTPLPSLCDTATAYITVNCLNDPPVVVDTPITNCEDCGPITVCVPITDPDQNSTFTIAQTLCGPNSGTATSSVVFNTVCLTYTSNTNFNGNDSICLVVCDNGVPQLCDTTKITITVTPVNDPPVALNNNYTTNEDQTLTVPVGTGVRANDNDNADNNPVTSLTVTTTPVVNVAHGTLTLSNDGSFVYVPTAQFCGSDSFQYRVCDNGTPLPSLCDTATAYITVNCLNDPPVVVDTPITNCEDCGPITVCVPITDPDQNSSFSIAQTLCGPNSGTATSSVVFNTVCLTYTSNTNFNGNDSICLVVCDNGSPQLCDTTKITITVIPVNDPPVALNNNYTTNEDQTLTVPTGTGVRANDNDNADNNPVTSLTVTTTPVVNVAHGTLTLSGDGSFVYVPTANYCGSDSFQYRVCDSGTPLPSLCDTATAYITVNCLNDPPVVVDTPIVTCEDCGPTTVCIPVTDPDVNQSYTVAAQFCGPNSGTASSSLVLGTLCVTYTANTNFNGQDSICLVVCDNGVPQACDTTHIHITVTPVNDPPIANNDGYSTSEDVTLTATTATGVRANDNDNADGNPVTSLTVSTTPVVGVNHGTLTLSGDGSFTFVPTAGFCGVDSFLYRVCDSGTPLPSLCDTATAYITINCVNDPPVVVDTTVTNCEDCGPITVCQPINDGDITDNHSYTLCGSPLWGNAVVTVTNNANTPDVLCVTYTPLANFNGLDSLCVIVCDNGTPSLCDTTHITINVTPVNDPPYADTIYVVTYQDQPVGVNVASATGDLEGNPLTYSYGTTTPANGTYTVTGLGAITVTPNSGFTGTFTIPYGVCDLSPYAVNVLCDSAAIVVTVLPAGDTLVNHAPVASNDYVTTPMGTAVVVNELANDYDVDGDALAVTVYQNPTHGTYTVNANGTVNYTPNSGFFGYDTIGYTICDPTALHLPKPLCDNALIVIYVSHDPTSVPNDAPVAVDDYAFLCSDGVETLNLLRNDYDPNGNALTSVTIIDNVNNGTLTAGSLGIYLYDPNTGFNGYDTLLYRVCDNGTPSLCDTAMAVIQVFGNPVITPSVSSITNCSGDSVNISFTTTVPGTLITWTATNGTSGTGNIHTVLNNLTSVNQTVTYTINGVAPGGCGSTTITVPVTVKPRPTATASVNGTIFCSGENVVINLNSNIAGTTYAWSGSNGTSGTGNNISDNPVNNGTANITVTYTIIPTAGTCSGDTLLVNVTVKPKPSLTANPTSQTICSGAPITVAISASIPGTSIQWSGSNGNSGNSATINDSPVNTQASDINVTYTINGTYNGCPANTIFSTVTVHPRVVADAGADKSATSCSASCVTLGGSPTGTGAGTLVYHWSPATGLSDTAVANPTACGVMANTTYTVTVTDGNNCSATDAMVLTVTPSSLTAEAGSGGSFCGTSGDSVMLGGFPTAVGGTAPYSYTWAPAGLNLTNPANPYAYPTASATYYLTVTDALGCQAFDSTRINVYPLVTANAGNDTSVCLGSPARLGGNPTASNGSGSGYAYHWGPTVGLSSSTSANPTATPAVTTTYTVTVTDGNGCTATSSVIVNVTSVPVAQAGVDKDLFMCPGDSVIIGDNPAAVGGNPGYVYVWTPNTGLSCDSCANPVVKGLTATQTYTLTVYDVNGCSSSDNVTVNVRPNNLTAHPGNSTQVCAGISVQLGGIPTAVGGTPSYVYNWSPSASLSSSTVANPVASPASTTTYNLTISDANGCQATGSVTVTVNPRPTANAGPDTSVCNGSAVAIGGSPSATGGTPAYTYSWNPTTGLSLPNVPNPQAAPVAVTTYQLVVTDSKGCAAVDEVTVTPRTNPVVDAGADKTLVACGGDTVFIGNLPVVVSGGTAPFTYDWTPGSFLSDSVGQNPIVTGLFTPGSYSYQLIVTDTFGCRGVDYVVVNVTPSTLQADAGNNAKVCANSSSPVTIGGAPTAAGGTTPYTYSWTSSPAGFTSSLPNPQVTPSTTTTYYVTVRDSKGCVSTDSVVVRFNAAPTANAGPDTAVCQGFCVQLGTASTGTGGSGTLQYAWTPTVGLNANNVANPLACPGITTTYVVQVTDTNGCQGSDAMTITVRPLPVANAGVDHQITACSGDSIRIGGSPTGSAGTSGPGGYVYSWSPASNLSCTGCANPWVVGLGTTTSYTVVVTDVYGCTATDATVIQIVPSTLTADAGNDLSMCFGTNGVTIGGAPTAVGGVPGYTYSWSGANLSSTTVANPVAAPAATTKYYVTVTDSKGCSTVDSMTVTVNPLPTANAGLDTAICAGNQVVLGGNPTASGGTAGYTYSWAPTTGLVGAGAANASNPLAQPAVTTTYAVTVVDSKGCRNSDNVQVTVRPNPIANAGPDKTIVACSSDSVQIGGSPTGSGGGGTFTYNWSPTGGLTDSVAANPYVKNIGSTINYNVTVTDQFGCSAADQVQVSVTNSSLVAEAGNNVAFCQGASVSVTVGGAPTAVGGTAPYSYVWSPSTTLSATNTPNPVATPNASTTYTVVVTDAHGCVASDTVRITINPRPAVNPGLPDTVCAGACITLGGAPTASGGTGSVYVYTWTPTNFLSAANIANPTACPTNSITYNVNVTDSLGCSNNASVTIRVNQNPVANAGADQSIVGCPNALVGIGGSPTATNGTAPYLYAWSPTAGFGCSNTGLPNPVICNLSVTTNYTLTVTDANGCTATDQVVVNVIPSNLSASAGPDKAICAEQGGGVVCVQIGGAPSVSGGTGPFTIDWSPVQGICDANNIANPTVSPTDTTVYTIVVTDANGCTAADSMVLFLNPAVTVVLPPDTAVCQGSPVQLGGAPTAEGGTPTINYSWNPGVGLTCTTCANPIATPFSTTTYCVTATDAVGCSSSACQTITANQGVVAHAGPDKQMVACGGSFVTIGDNPAATGGSGNYSYHWTPDSVGGKKVVFNPTQPNPLVISLDTTTLFTLTVVDNATGCTATDQVLVVVTPSTLQIDAGPNKVYCAASSPIAIGGSPTAQFGTGPYGYQWSPIPGLSDATIANPQANPLNTTTYYLTVTDQNGCMAYDSMTVIVSPQIAVNAGIDTLICTATDVVLGGNPVAVGGTGNYTYSWTPSQFLNGTAIAHPTAQGVTNNVTYTLTVTDSLGCQASDVVSIGLRPLPTANAGPDVAITSCSGDSAVLGGSPTASGTAGPYTYAWFPPFSQPTLSDYTAANPIIKQLGATQILTVTVTDVYGCKATDNVQVTVLPSTIFVEAGSNLGSLCANVGGCVNLGGVPTASGGFPPYNYQWFGGVTDSLVSNPQACPLGTTVYTVIVTDSKGCAAADSATVVVNQPTEASITGLNSQYCVNAGNVVMTGIPAGGVFSGPGITGNIFQPAVVGVGYYCIRYTYTNTTTGCTDDTTICVTVNPLPNVTISGLNPAYCKADPCVTITGTPAGGIFSGTGVSGNQFCPSQAAEGNNTVTYTYTDPVTGCSNTATFVVNVKGAPTLDVVASASTVCAGGSAILTPSYSLDVFNIVYSVLGGGNLTSGLNPVTVNPTGVDYCVVATAINTPNGCITRDTVCIHVNQNPVAVDDEANTCEEQPVSIPACLNDIDPENDVNTITVLSVAHGSASVNNCNINYTPAVNYNGFDTIVYQTCNSNCANACDTATVYVTICAVNDTPTIACVIDTIYQGQTDTACASVSDVDGDPVTVSIVTGQTINGTATVVNNCVVFTPDASFVGTQLIQIQACDTAGACSICTTTIEVLGANRPPHTVKVNATVCDSTSIGINVAAGSSDPDGDPLHFSYGPVNGPANSNGAITVTGNGTIQFWGDKPGYYFISYTACDTSNIPQYSLCSTNQIVVYVINCDSAANNHPPVATDDNATTTLNNPTVVNELANDFDADGDPLTVSNLGTPTLPGATITLNPDGSVTYTSPVVGCDSIDYVICDPYNACDTGAIFVCVSNVVTGNNPPAATDDFASTDYQTPVSIPVKANDSDPDGDPITVTSTPCLPANGTVQIVGSNILYTPNSSANANQPDTFCYVICDNGTPNLCDTATVVVYINNSVQGVPECLTTGSSRPVNVWNVLSNDFDPEQDSFYLVSVIQMPITQGTVSLNPNGTISYVPRADTCGFVDSFQYVISDVHGALDTVTNCVTIICCERPVAVDNQYTILPTDSVVLDVTVNDTLGGNPATVVIVGGPSNGSAYVTGTTIHYDPVNSFCGIDTVAYELQTVCGFDTAYLIVTVNCNTAPNAANDTVSICAGTQITIPVLANDVDPNGGQMTVIQVVTQPAAGSTTFNSTSVTYSSTQQPGTYVMTYSVCDDGLPNLCDTAQIVVFVNNCPAITVDTIYDTTFINTPVTHCLVPVTEVVSSTGFSISSFCDPQNGTVTITSDSCFTYVPDAGFFGVDTFCVTVCDSLGNCATAPVYIAVLDTLIQAVDEPCDVDSTIMNNAITLNVLDNDILPFGGDTTVTVLGTVPMGTASVNADNSITFIPAQDSSGLVQFQYQVCVTTGPYSFCDTASVCITVVDTTTDCDLPNIFTPNGDGVNDVFVIPCNQDNEKADLKIYDRWGAEVWRSHGHYQNNWDGHNEQGVVCPDGTYYFIYSYNDGTGRRDQKFVVIHR